MLGAGPQPGVVIRHPGFDQLGDGCADSCADRSANGGPKHGERVEAQQ
jgi:hypothetical protein